MKSKNERGLDRRVMDITSRVEQLVKKDFALQWWKPRKEDEYRLLRLLQWEEKYRVPIEWIMKLLVPIWKNKYAKHQKRGLGVSISTLVGQKSEEILVQCIRERFPDGENIAQWKARQKSKQFQATQEERRKLTWQEPTKTIRKYRKSILLQRERFRKFSQRMKRRKYRQNPFL